MARIVPVTGAGSRRVQSLLGDHVLTVRTYYNQLLRLWRMDLLADDSTPLRLNMAMVPGVNLLRADTELTRIYGSFYLVVAPNTDYQSPDALGSTAQLWWFAPGEIETPVIDPSLDPLPFDADAMFT